MNSPYGRSPIQFVMRPLRSAALPVTLSLLAVIGCDAMTGTPDDTPSARVIFDNLDASILSVSGTNDGDIYAVGADNEDGLGPYLLHFDRSDNQWQRLETSVSGDLWWISVETIDGVFYVVGENGTVLTLDPSDQSTDTMTIDDNPTLYGIWGTATDNLWTVGGDPEDIESGGVLLHFDGSAWIPVELGDILPDGVPTLYKVWGRDANDIYVVGRRGLALHFDGNEWVELETDTTSTIFTLHGDAQQVIATGGIGNGVIAELDGTMLNNRADVGTPQMNGISLNAGSSGVAVGNDGAIAVPGNDGTWQVQDNDVEIDGDFHAAWLDADGGIWAVGGDLSTALDNGLIYYDGEFDVSSNVRNP